MVCRICMNFQGQVQREGHVGHSLASSTCLPDSPLYWFPTNRHKLSGLKLPTFVLLELQRSKVWNGPTGLNSTCQQGCVISGGSGAGPISWPFPDAGATCSPWLEATTSIFNHSTLCSVITSPLALLGILVIILDPPDNPRESHLKILTFLLFANSLLPYKVMYSRVQGLGHLWRAIILSQPLE